MNSILIKNGTIVNHNKSIKSDILVKDNIIADISENIKDIPDNTKVIDANDLYVFPGAVDAHVHLDLPTHVGNSSDNFETGSKAAIYGGTTCIIDFVTPAKNESLLKALAERKKIVESCYVDYGFHMGITSWNSNTEEEIFKCVHNEGITSFKTYLAYKDTVGINDNEFLNILSSVAKIDGLVTIHCEHGDLIKKLQSDFINKGLTNPKYHALSHPEEAEAEAVFRAIKLAKAIKCKIYLVHISTGESTEIIRKAKNDNQLIFAETCPQYLFLDDSLYKKRDDEVLKYVMSPPLRNLCNQDKLWDGIKNNIFQVVATDHCPFNIKGQKDKGLSNFTRIPNGGNGIENRLSLLFTYGVMQKKITINKFVEITSTNPSKIFGIYPQKGVIAVNSDADIVIWNPYEKSIISSKFQHQRCDNNIFEGIEIYGRPEYVIVKGEIAIKGKNFCLDKPNGNYLYRKTFG